MKKILPSLLFLIIGLNLFAQNIGINNSAPTTALDVKGAIRTRPDSVTITQNYQHIDVSNSNFVRVNFTAPAPPAGDPMIILPSPGKDGQWLRLESIGTVAGGNNNYQVKLSNGIYLTNGKRLLLTDGEDFVFKNKGSYIELFYSEAIGWTETARNATYNGGVENKQTFTSSGTFTVPVGVTNITVALCGAGGYGGGAGSGTGGNGGFVAGSISVAYGETFTITVAEATSQSANAGYSSIKRPGNGNPLLLLAGGGGSGSANGGIGGHAGPVGADGVVGTGGSGGAGHGGTLVAGGAGGVKGNGITALPGGNGSSLNGGDNNATDGYGGSGYFGGGASGTYVLTIELAAAGGGGGGSNYTIGAGNGVTVTHNTHTGNINPAHPLYSGGGMGGSGNAQGGAGKVVISW